MPQQVAGASPSSPSHHHHQTLEGSISGRA